MESREEVELSGGYFDGIIAGLHPDCSRMGFVLVNQENPDEPDNPWWHAYFDSGKRNDEGLRVFVPKLEEEKNG